jgi:mRNA interferase MazF
MQEFPRQGSIHWFNPDPAEGSEIRKVRPCIVVSPDEMNSNLRTVIVVPLTTTVQPWPFRLKLTVLDTKTSAACDQIRVVDKRRLKGCVGVLRATDRKKLFSLLQSILSD